MSRPVDECRYGSVVENCHGINTVALNACTSLGSSARAVSLSFTLHRMTVLSLATHYSGVPARYILGIQSFTYSAFPAIPCRGQPLALVHSDALETVPCITLVAANRRDDAANLVIIGAIGHHFRAGRAVPGVVIRRRHVLRARPSARPFHVCVVAIPAADR